MPSHAHVCHVNDETFFDGNVSNDDWYIPSGIFLSTHTHIHDSEPAPSSTLYFESKLNITLSPADSPLRPNIKLSKFDSSVDEPCDPTIYRSIIGALNFISCASRYNITYSVNYMAYTWHMAQFMHCPSVIHFNELVGIYSLYLIVM